MKQAVIIGILLANLTFAQSLPKLTVREVYDFEIGDEFHYSVEYLNTPPCGKRVKIVDKFYSANQEILYYSKQYTSYTSRVDYSSSPPHLENTFVTGLESVSYTQLDSFINHTRIIDSCNFFHDTTFYKTDFYSVKVYSYTSCLGCCFEGTEKQEEFGKGIGRSYYRLAQAAHWREDRERLFYYKKGNYYFGNPSLVSVEKIENENAPISVYPNPTSDVLFFDNIQRKIYVQLNDIYGKSVLKSDLNEREVLETKNIPVGVYELIIDDGKNVTSQKLVISR